MARLQTLKKLHRPRKTSNSVYFWLQLYTNHTYRSPNKPPFKQRYTHPKYGILFHVREMFQTNINK